MTDNFGRNIDYIRISITDRCNLRCVYCMPEEGVENITHRNVLTFDEILRICKVLAKNVEKHYNIIEKSVKNERIFYETSFKRS